jgi:hypothetical protein
MLRFTYNNLNNGVSSNKNAMPQKDLTSDNQSSFERSRKSYIETVPNTSQMKWYGNRDASDVARKRRVVSVGKGTFNEQGNALSFTSSSEKNTVNNALRRTRAGGSTVPAKKTQTTNHMF